MERKLLLFVFAIIFLVAGGFNRRSLAKGKAQEKNLPEAEATIDRVIFSDGGNVKYYVRFLMDGKEILAQTVHYTSDTKSLNPGDRVTIGYYFTQNGTPRARILDDRVIPCADSVSNFSWILFAIGGSLVLAGTFI